MAKSKPAPSREQLITVSTRMFATYGFARTTLRAIADEAKVNQGMIHYYWRTKIALYEEVYKRVFEDFNKMVDESFSGVQALNLNTHEGKKEMANIVIREAFRLLERQPYIAHIIARHIMGDAEGTEHLIDDVARPLFNRASEILESFAREGYIRQQNMKHLVASLLFIFMGYHIGGGNYLFPGENFTGDPESKSRLAGFLSQLLQFAIVPEL